MRITRLGKGVDATGRLDPGRHRAHGRRAARVPRGHGPLRRRAGADDRHLRRPRRREPRRLLRRGRGRRRRCAPSCSAARRRAGSPSSGPPPTSTPPTARSSWCDIGGGSTEFSYGTDRVRGHDLHRHGLRAHHREPGSTATRPRPRSCQPGHLRSSRSTSTTWSARSRRPPRPATFVGLAGTVSTVAAVEIGLAEYDRDRIHHFVLTKRGGRGRLPHPRHRAARRPHPQPGPRARAGRRHRRGHAACWCRSCGDSGFRECLVSEADILDGLAMSIASGIVTGAAVPSPGRLPHPARGRR